MACGLARRRLVRLFAGLIAGGSGEPPGRQCSERPSVDLAGSFRRGFLIQILNPKAVVGWTLIIATGVCQDSPWYVPLAIVHGRPVLGTVIFSSCVLLFSSRMLRRETVASSTGFRYALVAVYAMPGLWLMLDSLQG